MKKTAFSKILIALFLWVSLLPTDSQNISYTSSGGLKLGFGLGSSYQASDITNSLGGGFDIWLGTPIYQQENAFFALDWRFRFLAGYNQAYDHRVNSLGSYDNIHLTHFNYDLEFVFTLNRLREQTGIVLSGFVGPGITHGITSGDLLDAANNPYDYSAVDPNRDPDEILADLDQLTDKDFETRLVNKAAILPTAGIYLGYQFTPHFAIGVEHKMNFSFSEQNSAFGINMDHLEIAGSSLDFINYTSLVFRWALGGGYGGADRHAKGAAEALQTAPVYPPQVDITTPDTESYVTSESSMKVLARVLNVTRKEDISVTLNGQKQDFMLYTSINRIEIPASLIMGSNTLSILCENEAGKDSDDVIIRRRSPSVVNPPGLQFINPPSGTEVEENRYPVKIRSTNIASREDITLSVNGRTMEQFDFDANGIISLDLILDEGRNDIVVSGINPDGTAEDRTDITYITSSYGLPPEVRIFYPVDQEVYTSDNRGEIRAEIFNVESSMDINFRINGRNSNDFTFNPATNELFASVPFLTSSTGIYIVAQNSFGSDSDSRTIIKDNQGLGIQPSLNLPAQTQPVQTQPIRTQPVQTQPVQTQPVQTQPVQTQPTRIQPVQTQPVQTQPVQSQPVQSQPAQESPVQTQPVQARPGQNRPVVTEPVVTQPVVTQPVVTQPVVTQPCDKPTISFSITGSEVSQLRGVVGNVENKSNIRLSVNGRQINAWTFNPVSGEIRASLNLNPGTSAIEVRANNECGSDRLTKSISIEEPCLPPTVDFSISEVSSASATHRISGSIKNVKSRNQVQLIVNGRPDPGFQFTPATGTFSHSLKLNPGTHTVVVNVNNECGADSETKQVVNAPKVVAPDPGGEVAANNNTGWVRINPGNSSWEFCLQTPGQEYNRSNLSNSNFSYSGTASSLYIKPIGGGGTARVNGKAYKLNPGQYYLFRGSLKVQVTNKQRGAMGQWSVYVESSTAPMTGKGNNRPKSPCEQEKVNGARGNRSIR